ncbi:MAG: Arm DNA-binding domain-containing protein [Sphingomonas bacterium]
MLTDAKVRTAKPRAKPYKLTDSNRLFLLVAPSGGKLWRWNYVYDGRQKSMAFGGYPLVSLSDARAKRDEAHTVLCEGRDPVIAKRLQIEANIEAARQRSRASRAGGTKMPRANGQKGMPTTSRAAWNAMSFPRSETCLSWISRRRSSSPCCARLRRGGRSRGLRSPSLALRFDRGAKGISRTASGMPLPGAIGGQGQVGHVCYSRRAAHAPPCTV